MAQGFAGVHEDIQDEVPLPFPEVFIALQQGVIDGAANPLTSILTFRWYESVKYVSLTNTAVGVRVMVINEPFFQKLTLHRFFGHQAVAPTPPTWTRTGS